MQIVKIIILLFALSNLVNAQSENKISEPIYNDAREKAQSIIADSRIAISANAKVDNVTGLTILFESKLPATGAFEEAITDFNFDILFPDKIRSHSVGRTSQNTATVTSILNGSSFDSVSEINSASNSSNINLSHGTKEGQIQNLKWRAWTLLFPIRLNSWYYPLEFKYVGVAESKDGKAQVIEAFSSSGSTNYRLFFDQNSHYLLLMTVSYQTNDNKKIETKYFFSDYRKNAGLVVAHKIDIQQNGTLIEQRTIKSLKVNPDFKANNFNVKN